MFDLGNLWFAIEILVGELLFLFSCPRRKFFLLRFAGAVAGALLLSYFFPLPQGIRYNAFYSVLRFIVLFSYTIGAMALSFDLKTLPLFSYCMAGYCVQHIAYQIGQIFLHLTPMYEGAAHRVQLVELTVFPVAYLILFLIFGLFAKRNHSYRQNSWRLLTISIATVFICIGLMRFSRQDAYSVTGSLYAITCCVLVLIMQFYLYRMLALLSENKAIRLMWQEEKKQYEISRNTIELVNIKYHDLKRRLSSMTGLTQEEVDSLKETLQLYDSNFRTGNQVLDVILTELSLRYRGQGIGFTFMGNGAELDFMGVTDIYSLFGNALENAVEAVQTLENPEQKVIGVAIERKGDMLFVSVTNYFSSRLVMQGGIPVTSKRTEEGYHGFGIKSIKLISEKYHGDMTITADGDLFTLNVYLSGAAPARRADRA